MPFFRNKVIWSIVEIDYLKAHRNDTDENQLSLALYKSRNAIKNKLLELDGKLKPKKASKKRTNIGKRKDLGIFCRSNWEANTLRYLKDLGLKFQYEPEVFTFPGVKHGTVSYCPDIKLEDGTWIEVKGFLDGRGKTQIRRFKKHFPKEFTKLKVIVASDKTAAAKFFQELNIPVFAYYNQMNKENKDRIPNWE